MNEGGTHNEVVRYGADVPTERELKLLGNLEGRRVLELGSGSRSNAVALAHQGAHVIAVDPHPERLALSRALAEEHEVRVEWHEAAFSDLAFLRADSVDLALSTGAVAEVEDIGRLFRQVHRVLKPGAAFVLAYDHPASLVAGGRSYFDGTPVTAHVDRVEVTVHPRPLSEVFHTLVRSGYRVELLLEPRPVSVAALVPPTVIWRARKEGV